MKNIKELYLRHKEIVNYMFFGAMTTVIDFAVYTPLTAIFGADYKIVGFIPWYMITSVIAWIAAVMFAYFTNKKWVFYGKDWSSGTVAREFASFAGGRVLTLMIQLFLMWFMIDLTHLNDTPPFTFIAGILGFEGDFAVKVAVTLVVVILNYIISKLFVFRPKKDGETLDS